MESHNYELRASQASRLACCLRLMLSLSWLVARRVVVAAGYFAARPSAALRAAATAWRRGRSPSRRGRSPSRRVPGARWERSVSARSARAAGAPPARHSRAGRSSPSRWRAWPCRTRSTPSPGCCAPARPVRVQSVPAPRTSPCSRSPRTCSPDCLTRKARRGSRRTGTRPRPSWCRSSAADDRPPRRRRCRRTDAVRGCDM
ncbi:hypothetical protein T492DRAFT_490066 [Pavlovales sp. CCMP2436]|nr:hypothetical protein T492DRAFT_490066 [Pavlovales sp. CCMP2436]